MGSRLADKTIEHILDCWDESEDELDFSDLEEDENNIEIMDEGNFINEETAMDISEDEYISEMQSASGINYNNEEPSTSSVNSNLKQNFNIRNLIWKKANITMNEEALRFQNTPLPATVMELSTPSDFFRYFFYKRLFGQYSKSI